MIYRLSFLFFTILLFSQIDSYSLDSRQSEDEELIKQRADEIYFTSEKYFDKYPDSLLFYADELRRMSTEINYTKGFIYASFLAGTGYFDKKQYDKAAQEIYSGLDIIAENYTPDLRIKKVILLQLLAVTYDETGNYAHTIEIDKKALEIAHELGDSVSLGDLYFNIGIAYYHSKEYSEAKSALQEALTYRIGTDYHIDISKVNNMIGLVYIENEDFDKAIHYFEKAIHEYPEASSEEIWYLSNIGLCYVQKQDFETAISYYNEAYQLSIELKDDQKKTSTANNLGETYLKMKKYQKAISFSRISMGLTDTSGQYQQVLGLENQEVFDPEYERAVRNIAEAYQQMGEYEKALQYQEMQAQAKLLEQKSQYEVKEVGLMAENQVAQQKLDSIASEKSTFIIAIIVVFLSLTSLLLMAFMYYKGIPLIKKWFASDAS